MSGKFTQDDILTMFERLHPGVTVVSRYDNVDPENIVLGIKDLVFGSVNSDIDSVYAILLIFIKNQIIMGNAALSLVEDVKRLAVAAQGDSANPDVKKYDTLIDTLDKLTASTGSQATADLLTKFKNTSKLFSSSSKTAKGAHYTGVSPSTAKSLAVTKSIEVVDILSDMQTATTYILDAVSDYMDAPLGEGYLERQAKHLNAELQAIKEQDTDDLAETVLATNIAATLLEEKAEKRDITLPKWEGPVDTLPGSHAEMLGYTTPFKFPGQNEQATLLVNGAYTGTVEAPFSKSAYKEVLLPNALFKQTDFGTVTVSASGQYWISSDGQEPTGAVNPTGMSGPYLKTVVVPKSVAVNFFVDLSVNEPSPVTLTDDGHGNLVGGASTLFAQTPGYLVPNEGVPDLSGQYTFPAGTLEVVGVPGSIDISVLEGNPPAALAHIVDEVTDPGKLWFATQQIPNDPPIGTIDYSTGSMTLDLSSLLAAEESIWLVRYTYSIAGLVNYDTGEISIVSGPDPFHDNMDVSIAYEYHPIGKFSHVVDGTVQSTYEEIGFIINNNPRTYALPVPDPWVQGTNAETTNLPVRSLGDLFPKLQIASELDGTTILSDLYLAQAGNNDLVLQNVWSTTYGTVGSLDRLTVPNYTPAQINTDPFSPTWLGSPDKLNKVTSLVHSIVGDSFGEDTLLSSVTVPGTAAEDATVTMSDLITVTTSPADIFEGTATFDGANAGRFVVQSEDIFEEGDDVLVKLGHVIGHGKVAGTLPTGEETSTGVLLQEGIPKQVASGVTLSDLDSCEVSITRNKIRVFSNSKESSSSLKVVTPGFGLSGTALNASVEVLLKVELTDIYPKAGYIIRKGDPVYEGDKRIGVVGAVDGTVVILFIDEGLVANVDYTYPFASLKIVALGWDTLRLIKTRLELYSGELEKVLEESFTTKTSTYASSGTGYVQFMTAANDLSSLVVSLVLVYLEYSSHVVDAVNTLLSSLKEEKLTLIYGLLSSMQFSDLADLTSASLSDQKEIEGLLEDLILEYGGNTEFIDIFAGIQLLDDFSFRGEDSLDELPTMEGE